MQFAPCPTDAVFEASITYSNGTPRAGRFHYPADATGDQLLARAWSIFSWARVGELRNSTLTVVRISDVVAEAA